MMVYSCSSVHQNEKARFLHAIKKDIPFKTDNFREIGHQTYAFDNADGIVQPDYEINNYGERFVARTTFGGEVSQRTDSTFWRNLYFNNRRHRLICVDRLSIQGEAKGLVYVMQMKSKRWPKEGTYNWDVTDRRNMQSAANVLDDYEKLTLRAMNSDVMPDVEANKRYNEAIRKADACYLNKSYQEAIRHFREAFRNENCIKGYHLYNAACVSALAGDKDAAFSFLKQRVELDSEWYPQDVLADRDLAPLHSDSRWTAYAQEMTDRKKRKEAGYDTALRHKLQEIAKSDQSIRHQWHTQIRLHPKDTVRINGILKEMQQTDSINLSKICHILDARGFVGRKKVGDACDAYWLVIQHAPLAYQKKYLPLFRKAAEKGDISKEKIAMMEDRVCMFEGKPQKYGSQLIKGKDGKWHVYQLLDADKVDDYRKAAGMQPLEEYLKQMGALY